MVSARVAHALRAAPPAPLALAKAPRATALITATTSRACRGAWLTPGLPRRRWRGRNSIHNSGSRTSVSTSSSSSSSSSSGRGSSVEVAYDDEGERHEAFTAEGRGRNSGAVEDDLDVQAMLHELFHGEGGGMEGDSQPHAAHRGDRAPKDGGDDGNAFASVVVSSINEDGGDDDGGSRFGKGSAGGGVTTEQGVLMAALNLCWQPLSNAVGCDGRSLAERALATALGLRRLGLAADAAALAFLREAAAARLLTVDQVEAAMGLGAARRLHDCLRMAAAPARLDSMDEERAAQLRQWALAFLDWQAVLVELAARREEARRDTHAMVPYQQQIWALETLTVHAPLAHALGVGALMWELEDAAFRFIFPKSYSSIATYMAQHWRKGESVLQVCLRQLEAVLREDEQLSKLAESFVITGRTKNVYSAMRKLLKKRRKEDIYDILGLRVVLTPRDDSPQVEAAACYRVLEVACELWNPVIGRMKDYIACPKVNGYRSLHATVLVDNAEFPLPLELQVRSEQMHRFNEGGPAAHSGYKAGLAKPKQVEQLVSFARTAAVGYQLPQPRLAVEDLLAESSNSGKDNAGSASSSGTGGSSTSNGEQSMGEELLLRSEVVHLAAENDTAPRDAEEDAGSDGTNAGEAHDAATMATTKATAASRVRFEGDGRSQQDDEQSAQAAGSPRTAASFDAGDELSVQAYETLVREVQELQRCGQRRRALQVLTVQTQRYSGDSRLWFLLGEQLLKSGRVVDGRKAMERAVEEGRGSPRYVASLLLQWAKLERGRRPQAARFASLLHARALAVAAHNRSKAEPSSAGPSDDTGGGSGSSSSSSSTKNGDLQAVVLHSWASLELKRGDAPRAVTLAQQGLDFAPGDAHLLHVLGMGYQRQGNLQLAYEKFLMASVVRPDDTRVLLSWGQLEASRGNMEEARAIFERGLQVAPESSYLLQAWAVAEAKFGEPARARQLFQRCAARLRNGAGAVQLWHAWGMLEADQGLLPRARTLFRRCVDFEC